MKTRRSSQASRGEKRRATAVIHSGPLERKTNLLARFTPAQQGRKTGRETSAAHAKDRKQSGHLRHWNRDSADVVNLRAGVRTGAAGGLGGEVGRAQLIGIGDDGEFSQSRATANGCVAG